MIVVIWIKLSHLELTNLMVDKHSEICYSAVLVNISGVEEPRTYAVMLVYHLIGEVSSTQHILRVVCYIDGYFLLLLGL